MKCISAAGVLPTVISCISVLSIAGAVPTNWTVRASASSQQLNGVGYGGGLFVAVGSQATILTSADGINWVPRSAGMTAPTLWSVAYGNGRYVIGGGEGGLILTSTNGIQWTSVLSTIGTENVNGLTYGYGEFVGVGRGGATSSGHIITSSNGLDWVTRAVPSTNTLFAISPAFSADGTGWADYLYVAVGDHGTIVTSTNGVDWVLRNSGTTVPLRSVAWHGQMIVGGDAGTILTSPNGITWTSVAPTSFGNRGMVSRFDDPAVVAVGNFTASGRLHASLNGTSWPGLSLQFDQSLNGIAYGNETFVAVGNGGLIVQSGVGGGETNDWMKPTSGLWEESFWSLNKLPAVGQALIAFRNGGWKALAIGSSTAAGFPESMLIGNLLVDAPADSVNQLLLSWAGLEVPLMVQSNFTIGVNGSLASHFSRLEAGQMDLRGDATFSDASEAEMQQLFLRSDAELNLNDAFLMISNLTVVRGTFTQDGGMNLVETMMLPDVQDPFSGADGNYMLNSGVLYSEDVTIGEPTLTAQGFGHFQQSGGAHTNSNMTIWGYTRTRTAHYVGFYTLSGGMLVSDNIDLLTGKFTQSGGSNFIGRLGIQWAGNYFQGGGTLVTSNVTIDVSGGIETAFVQTGGVHTVQQLVLAGHETSFPFYLVRYSLTGGTLDAEAIDIIGAALNMSGGVVSNSGIVTIQAGGALVAGTVTAQLGRLHITNGAYLDMASYPWFDDGAGILYFRDSREIPWSGPLEILHWEPGVDHIFIGTNSQGVTAAQLSQVSFVYPGGWPTGPFGEAMQYPAAILASGEVVPAIPPPLQVTGRAGSLILSWDGPYELVTATNVLGPYVPVPGATSPITNAFVDRERYFRLALPGP